ncbi:MAG: hypothetical protein AAF968_18110, partial [Pseudomonadota bacterium]
MTTSGAAALAIALRAPLALAARLATAVGLGTGRLLIAAGRPSAPLAARLAAPPLAAFAGLLGALFVWLSTMAALLAAGWATAPTPAAFPFPVGCTRAAGPAPLGAPAGAEREREEHLRLRRCFGRIVLANRFGGRLRA